jgi:hypothetical protein
MREFKDSVTGKDKDELPESTTQDKPEPTAATAEPAAVKPEPTTVTPASEQKS